MSETTNIVDTANQLLTFLANNSREDWADALKDALETKEHDQAIKTLEKNLEDHNLEAPKAVFIGSTNAMKEASGVEGEEAQQAILLLKSEGRLQQCGRGRGKCLILLDDSPVNNNATMPVAKPKAEAKVDEETEADEELRMVEADDFNGLLRALRDRHRTETRMVTRLERENNKLTAKLQSAEEELREVTTRLGELAKQHTSTWT